MVNEQPQEFSVEFKFAVVMEALQAKKDAVDICLKFNISEAQQTST